MTGDAAGDASGDAAAVTATGETPAVAVSAVEIEGKKIFVAGNAKAGALVRIYADDRLVGETKTDEQGRFVVDGTLDLPVGNHTIRADMMSADGSKVELRAAVPFDRPEGDQVAAVAQGNAQGSVVPFDGGSFDGLRLEATKALSLLKGLFANGKVPTAEELAAARSSTEIALKSLADFKVADNLDANVKEMAAKTAKSATDALTMLKALPKDAASVSAALVKIEAAVGSALMPRTDGTGNDAVASQRDAAVKKLADTERRFVQMAKKKQAEHSAKVLSDPSHTDSRHGDARLGMDCSYALSSICLPTTAGLSQQSCPTSYAGFLCTQMAVDDGGLTQILETECHPCVHSFALVWCPHRS